MIEDMNATPMANRYTIGIFGRRNAGKSSLINALTGQEIALTSEVAGTTTDPVYKAMELLPIGPVVLIDTAGLDDSGELGLKRVEKSYEVLRKCHFVVLVTDAREGLTPFEEEFVRELRLRKIPCLCVMNKADGLDVPPAAGPAKAPGVGEAPRVLRVPEDIPVILASALTGEGIDEVKRQIVAHADYEDVEPALVGDLIRPGDVAVLVTPIDKSAPKGRLILPQQQTIRDILEIDASALVTKDQELKLTLERLAAPPAIVITDSQAFLKVAADTPDPVPMTSFSILFARQKGDLAEMVRGIGRIERLRPGEKVLIVEGCTHHRQADDIGRVKIPRWIRQIAGGDIRFDWASGACFPRDLSDCAVVVHCGGCMLNRREMQYRILKARESGAHITNYGMLIAHVQGILERALKPFPAAALAWEEEFRA
jgi:[FeFe] hydrogenase H-cluster maturation GTPase HydF